MTDRELLERAAKAAGIVQSKAMSSSMGICLDIHPPTESSMAVRIWNPLTDDGDALRLAVRLKIEPKWPYTGEAWAVKGETLIMEDGGADICAATRRAIVRGAAEMAK